MRKSITFALSVVVLAALASAGCDSGTPSGPSGPKVSTSLPDENKPKAPSVPIPKE